MDWATATTSPRRPRPPLSVIMISNLMAILLQALAARLGIASGRDLAQACRDHYSRPVTIALWIICELAIAACDLAEVIGSAIALNLLFGLPLIWGVCITALDVLVVLYLHHGSTCQASSSVSSSPRGIVRHRALLREADLPLSPPGSSRASVVTDPNQFYIAIGISARR
jgi:manganese transport protein